MSNSPQNNRLRRIAILVGSVDSKAASQLLVHLPTDVAMQVRSMSRELRDVTPAERAAILSEFQRSAKPTDGVVSPKQSSAVQPLASPAMQPSGAAEQAKLNESNLDENLPSWAKLGTEALLRFVATERTPVVAVIISQLPAQRGADLLSRLPPSTATEVLRQVGKLQDIDPDAMAAIDEHLATTLDEFQHRIESERENASKLYALLAAAPGELQSVWAEAIQPQQDAKPTEQATAEPQTREPQPADSSNWQQAVDRELPAVASQEDLAHELDDIYRDSVITTAEDVVDEIAEADVLPLVHPEHLRQQFESLLELPVEQLARLLSEIDTRTVLMGLAGASPKFMRKFYQMLEPADAHALREKLQGIGPLRLREVDIAQQTICKLADDMFPSTEINPAATLSRAA